MNSTCFHHSNPIVLYGSSSKVSQFLLNKTEFLKHGCINQYRVNVSAEWLGRTQISINLPQIRGYKVGQHGPPMRVSRSHHRCKDKSILQIVMRVKGCIRLVSWPLPGLIPSYEICLRELSTRQREMCVSYRDLN